MKKTLITFITINLVSCAVQKKAAKDPYVGVYDITIFDAPQAGDVPLRLTINKENSSYSSSFENKAGSQLAEMGIEWEVDSTSVEDGIVRIEGYVSTYEVYFELNIDGDDISGSLAGMFDVEGVRVDKP
tara:strand:- start:885 stop:1271 length:387 start_codon:yes stop_codon:yes gene_type:complete